MEVAIDLGIGWLKWKHTFECCLTCSFQLIPFCLFTRLKQQNVVALLEIEALDVAAAATPSIVVALVFVATCEVDTISLTNFVDPGTFYQLCPNHQNEQI